MTIQQDQKEIAAYTLLSTPMPSQKNYGSQREAVTIMVN
jgi:hypothetical protein